MVVRRSDIKTPSKPPSRISTYQQSWEQIAQERAVWLVCLDKERRILAQCLRAHPTHHPLQQQIFFYLMLLLPMLIYMRPVCPNGLLDPFPRPPPPPQHTHARAKKKKKNGLKLSEIWNTVLASISQLTSCVGWDHLTGLLSVINPCAILLVS